MVVYQRPGNGIYSYDFRFDGNRYSGSTGVYARDEAQEIERRIRGELYNENSGFCRAIIRRAKSKLPEKTKAKCGYVYMIRSGYFIKIGHSLDPAERFRTISTATPDGCELLFFFRGSMQLERQMHREFSACHFKKEWFFLCGKLKRFVEEFERSQLHGDDSEITQKFHAA